MLRHLPLNAAMPDDPGQTFFREKERAALVSLAVKLALTAGKFAAAALSGSLALASEAGNNLGDVATTALSLYSIRVAAKPADAEHQFGHGKVEAVSALAQTGFLFALAVFILVEATRRLVSGEADVRPDAFAFIVLAISIVVDLARWTSLSRIARKTRSPALSADALNFATDIVASSLALVGLVAAVLGYRSGDAVAAVAVACFIGVSGYRLARETVDTLLDTAPPGLTDPIARRIATVPGIIAVKHVRLRHVGREIMGDAVICVPRTFSIERVEAVRKSMDALLGQVYPDLRLAATVEPVALDDETVVERVFLIANRLKMPVHHVTVQTLDTGSRSVSFDVELDARMTLASAHEEVTRLESGIKHELGETFEVESHLEPLEIGELAGRDEDGTTSARIAAVLANQALDVPELHNIHDVRVRATDIGLVINYHCHADGEMSVGDVHWKVDRLDRLVRTACRDIVRIVGHAEPAAIEPLPHPPADATPSVTERS